MSCGHPHETDCREVLAQLDEYLDGELDADRRALREVRQVDVEEFSRRRPVVEPNSWPRSVR